MNENLKENKINEAPTNQQQQEVDKKLTTLKGITTSRIEQALKAKSSYPARVFLKIEGQEQDIPVFFRIKYEKDSCQFHSECPWYCNEKGSWIRPKIRKGSALQVEGRFTDFHGTERKSFTAYSYQLLNQEQAEILSHGK